MREISVALDSILEHLFASLWQWGPTRPGLGRPIAAPLERCAQSCFASTWPPSASWPHAAERQRRPEAYGRRRGGYLDRRRTLAADA
jgi:hypothetical protein